MYAKTFASLAVALIGAATLTVAHAGVVGETTPDYPSAYTSTVTRAAVREAALAARAAGQIVMGDQDVVIEGKGPGLSRAQVQAETLEAIRLGLIGRGEHNVLPTDAQLRQVQMAGLKALSMSVAGL